jgi:prepilin-type N-terminal cleavage/methylation domain-containing protein
LETGPSKSRCAAAGSTSKARTPEALTPKALTPKAFTLLELVLVMLLISIALAVSAPSLRGFWAGTKSKNAATQIVALTKWARSKAVARGTVYRLNFSNGQYGVTMQDQQNFVAADSSIGQTFDLPEGVQLEVKRNDGADGDHLDFFPDGTCDVATITMKEPDGSQLQITCASPTEGYKLLDPNNPNGGVK